MRLSVEETVEAQYFEETLISGRSRSHTQRVQISSKKRGKSLNSYYTYCKKGAHQVLDFWPLARKNKGKKPDRKAGSFESEQQRSKIYLVVKSLTEVLSPESSSTRKIL